MLVLIACSIGAYIGASSGAGQQAAAAAGAKPAVAGSTESIYSRIHSKPIPPRAVAAAPERVAQVTVRQAAHGEASELAAGPDAPAVSVRPAALRPRAP